ELLVDELHDLLAWVQRLEHVGAQRALLHRRRELLDDLEVHVRLEQREADRAHCLVDVVLGELAPRADVAEGGLEPLRERVEHRLLRLAGGARQPPTLSRYPAASAVAATTRTAAAPPAPRSPPSARCS